MTKKTKNIVEQSPVANSSQSATSKTLPGDSACPNDSSWLTGAATLGVLLLGILLLFHWVSLVGVVRAEFLRGRNFEYIKAARALGLSNPAIMFKHLLPNAMVATLTFLPFKLSGSITALTALEHGYGAKPVFIGCGGSRYCANGQRKRRWRFHSYSSVVHWIVWFEADTRAGRIFDLVLLWLIIFSVIVVILESIPSGYHLSSSQSWANH